MIKFKFSLEQRNKLRVLFYKHAKNWRKEDFESNHFIDEIESAADFNGKYLVDRETLERFYDQGGEDEGSAEIGGLPVKGFDQLLKELEEKDGL